MKEIEISEFVSQMKRPETFRMLYLLAAAFTGLSSIERVPDGTHEWIIQRNEKGNYLLRKDENGKIALKSITIKLIPFFGMLIGYDRSIDTLIYCKEGVPNA